MIRSLLSLALVAAAPGPVPTDPPKDGVELIGMRGRYDGKWYRTRGS